MSEIYRLFAGLDGTGNHMENDKDVGDGSQTNVVKLYDLYRSTASDKDNVL